MKKMEERTCYDCIHKDVCSIREILRKCIREIRSDSSASFHDGFKFLNSLPEYCEYFLWGRGKNDG